MHSNTLLPALLLVLFATWVTSQEVLGSADSVCAGTSFGILPHPTNCRQYYVCVNYRGSVNQCGYNFVFDPRVSFCVHQSMYQCPNTAQPTTAAPPTDAPPSSTTAPESPSTPPPPSCPETSWESLFCRNRMLPLTANPFNCTQFINCDLKQPTNLGCPPGTVFSLQYQDCFPGDSGRCLPQPVDPGFCETRPTGNYPHPYRCNRFVTCFQNSPREESCPPYYVFDPQTVRCVRGNVLDCSSLLSSEV